MSKVIDYTIPIGLRFRHYKELDNKYQISEIEDDTVVVSWIEDGNILSTLYEYKFVVEMFKDKVWNVV